MSAHDTQATSNGSGSAAWSRPWTHLYPDSDIKRSLGRRVVESLPDA